MKFSNDDLKSVHLLGEQHDGESKVSDGDNSTNTRLFLSEKDAEQHCESLKETVAEKDKLSNLVMTSKHLAHQLNNLLTAILANTQLMLLMVKEEELKSYLNVVEDATRDAGAIVEEFQISVCSLAELSPQENVLDET